MSGVGSGRFDSVLAGDDVKVNSAGMLFFLALSGAVVWLFIPIGPVWAISSVILAAVIMRIVVHLAEWSLAAVEKAKYQAEMRDAEATE